MNPFEPEFARSRLAWRLWIATVAGIVVVSLVAWVLIIQRIPGQRLEVYNATLNPVAPVYPHRYTPNVSTPAYAHPVVAPGTVWVNTRSRIYHYPGYRWYGATI